MNAGVHRIKRIWQRCTTCWCWQICFICRTLAFIVLFRLFVVLVSFVVQQHCPKMQELFTKVYIFFMIRWGGAIKKSLSIEVEKQDFSCSICKTMKKLYLCKSGAKTCALFTRNSCRASWTLFLILPLFHVHHVGVVKSSWGWLDLTAGWNGM